MKVFVICLLVSVVSCGRIEKRQTNNINNNINNIEELLKELEKANNNVSKDINTVRNDTPVRDALNRLFGAFQQMASAYVGVLTSVGKSIGLPTIPIGSTVQFMQSPSDSPIVIKQIQENLRQFQDSVQEVSKTVSNMVTRDGPVDNYVLLNEMQKFMILWSNQIQDVSEQITRAFGGLEADLKDVNERTIPPSLTNLVNNMVKIFDDAVDRISQNLNKMIGGDPVPEQPNPEQSGKPNVRDENKPSKANTDMLREFKNLLETIQKRMRIISLQLDTLLANPPPSDKLVAEHREGTDSQTNSI